MCGAALEILKDVIIGLITGVAASAAYEKLVAFRRDRALKAKFGGLQGEYAELLRTPNSKITLTGGTITVAYLGGRKFSTRATNDRGQQEWHGEFSMSDGTDVLGTGFYQYINRDDNGIHRIVYISTLKQFDVSGENTSHPEGVKDFKIIWKRK
jgi:hypothetical protein